MLAISRVQRWNHSVAACGCSWADNVRCSSGCSLSAMAWSAFDLVRCWLNGSDLKADLCLDFWIFCIVYLMVAWCIERENSLLNSFSYLLQKGYSRIAQSERWNVISFNYEITLIVETQTSFTVMINKAGALRRMSHLQVCSSEQFPFVFFLSPVYAWVPHWLLFVDANIIAFNKR